MHKRLFVLSLIIVLILALCTVGVTKETAKKTTSKKTTAKKEAVESPNIEGTYKLIKRDLTNGKTLSPPDIQGMITFTKKYRNFNIYWKNPDGKWNTISIISEYKLTPKEYTEKNIYYVINDQIGGTGITFDLADSSGSSPVKMDKSGAFYMNFPLHGEPSVEFKGNMMIATREGQFIDYWEKVQ